MSFDLEIMPLCAVPVTWGRVRDRWRERLGERARPWLGLRPRLLRLGKGTAIGDDEPLVPGLDGYFELSGRSTLGLSASLNGPMMLDEHLYLEDYGRNLTPTETEDLAQQWRRVGYCFALTSGGGRPREEPAILIALACALAERCEGRIILMNDGYLDLDVGVYSPEHFERARWIV